MGKTVDFRYLLRSNLDERTVSLEAFMDFTLNGSLNCLCYDESLLQ